MSDANLQKELFNHIRESLPPHISLVDEMADLLNLSPDSVYRRIRGEKPVPLQELKLLCEHFNLSLDQVLQLQTNNVMFTDEEAQAPVKDFKQYLGGILQLVQHFNSFNQRQMFYLSKDIPIFYFYYFKEIAAFKSFFWSRSILNEPEFEDRHFSLEDFDASEYFALGQKILKAYNLLPSVELWNYESINSTLLQLEFYRDAGIFKNREDLMKVLDSCDAMLLHLQKQLEKGCKFLPGVSEEGYGAELKFYINEIILGNNNILVELEGNRTTYINHIVLKYISTTDKKFNERAFHNFNNLASRSVLISGTGEKERNKFFKALREKVQALRK